LFKDIRRLILIGLTGFAICGQAEASKLYRHYISSTAERDGKELFTRELIEMQSLEFV